MRIDRNIPSLSQADDLEIQAGKVQRTRNFLKHFTTASEAPNVSLIFALFCEVQMENYYSRLTLPVPSEAGTHFINFTCCFSVYIRHCRRSFHAAFPAPLLHNANIRNANFHAFCGAVILCMKSCLTSIIASKATVIRDHYGNYFRKFP